MPPKNIDAKFLQERRDAISKGLKEGIRREVQRLADLGVPIIVERDGRRGPAQEPTTADVEASV